MTKDVLKPQLWTERPVEETVEVYTGWAKDYDSDLAQRVYHTPARIAEALAAHLPDRAAPVLDFGCGTGLSGAALQALGIGPLHGTDITPAMLDLAGPKNIYEKLWLSAPGALDIQPGDYRAIVATGVISLGAAPAETMDLIFDRLAPGDLLAMSFNDPTLAHGGFDARLQGHLDAGTAQMLFRQHGPHLDDIGMGSDVMVLRRL